MKLAPWLGLAAIAVLLGAVAWSRSEPCTCEKGAPMALDFHGIDTLEVTGYSPDVKLTGAKPTQYAKPTDAVVHVTREGTTLRIRAADDVSVDVTAPASLRRLLLPAGGDVDAEHASVEALAIEARGRLHWSGDARGLRIDHRGDEARCSKQDWDCRSSVTIESGHVERLEASLPKGELTLEHASDVAHVVLTPGPTTKYSFQNMHGPAPRVDILAPAATDGDPPDAVPGDDDSGEGSGATDAVAIPAPNPTNSAPAEPAPEPPRPR